jgi:hypothetical protein
MANGASRGAKPLLMMLLGFVVGGAAGYLVCESRSHGRGAPHFRRIRFVNASGKPVTELHVTPGTGSPTTDYGPVDNGKSKYTTMRYADTSAAMTVRVTGKYDDTGIKEMPPITFMPGGDNAIDEILVFFAPDLKLYGHAWYHAADDAMIADPPQSKP